MAVPEKRSPELEKCIVECLNCHSLCIESIEHCLNIGGKHAAPDHIRLLMDCAEICQSSANLMLAHSYFMDRTCEICAEICVACAESCEKLLDDQQMRACASACRRCAEACREMVTEMAA